MDIDDIQAIKKEKNRIYQRAYYRKNRSYHILYNLRKRLIDTGFAKETGDGKLFSTGKYTRDVSDIAESMGLTQTGDLRKLDQEALKANSKKGGGFQIEKKTGGPLKLPPNPGAAALPTNVRNKMGYMKDGGRAKKFPDLTGDGKVTRADVLKGRGVFAAGGKVKNKILKEMFKTQKEYFKIPGKVRKEMKKNKKGKQ